MIPFIDAGQNNFVMPLLQGFVGQRPFTMQRNASTGQGSVVGAVEEAGDVVAAQDKEISTTGTKFVSLNLDGIR